jgi:hypothetical protein
MFSQNSFHTRPVLNWLVIVAIAFVVFKLWMVGGHELMAKFRPHDDSLFATLAINLLEGNWLGDYSNKTLIKGVGYPMFMVISFWSGIPILTLQHLLYVVSCLLVVVALRPNVRNGALLGVFLLLLFNPLTYSYPLMSATLRSSLYLSLILSVFAAAMGLWNRRNRMDGTALLWSLVLAISFTWLWNTREESVWILPAMVVFAVVYVAPFSWNAGSSPVFRLVMLVIPLLVYVAAQFTIIQLNEKHYRVGVINELKSDEFTSALGGLMNIRPEKPERHVTVSIDAEQKAFEASPTFARLRPFLEGKSKMLAAFYIWRLRSAVRRAGYYDRPDDATREFEFYRQMGEELRIACETGKLIRPAWHSEFNGDILPVFSELTAQAFTFSLFQPDSSGFASKEDMDTLFAYNLLTGEDALRKSQYFAPKLPEYYRDMVARKQGLMGLFGKLYKYGVPLLFAVALVLHLFWLVRMAMRRELKARPVFGLVLLGSIISILVMLTFVKITIWPVTRPMHNLSPLVLLYISYMLLPFEKDG